MKDKTTPRKENETTLVGQIAAGVSLLTLSVYLRRGDLLLYGDAVAHMNIARRVFDSRTPGLLQLGTVWLPLPHIFMIPFVLSNAAWRTGIAGAIPSMAAYVLGTIGIFRLVRNALGSDPAHDSSARVVAWLAAVIYAANPNLLYMQTTAMTEPLALAWFIWAVVHFTEFAREIRASDCRAAGKSLVKCGACLAGACLTRYDGWFQTGVVALAVAAVFVKYGLSQRQLRIAFVKFVLLAAASPVLWLGYNAVVYRNPLEFANGPYSAKAIEQRTSTASMPTYPGAGNPKVAFSYILKAGEQTVAEGLWQKVWIVLLVAGVLGILIRQRERWPLLLLLIPLPFYVLSLSYGDVPIFLPEWWPFSFYNVRFGLELLPAFVVLASMVLYFVLSALRQKREQIAASIVFALIVAGSYTFVWRAQPICFREAWANSRSRIALETQLAKTLRLLPHDSTLLMYSGDHVGALQDAGIPLRRTINEGNHRPWIKPRDADGLWERALADPKQYADYVVSIGDDAVAKEVARADLTSMVVLRVEGQPPATIYWTHRGER